MTVYIEYKRAADGSEEDVIGHASVRGKEAMMRRIAYANVALMNCEELRNGRPAVWGVREVKVLVD